MHIKLKGRLVRDLSRREIEFSFGKPVTLDEFLEALSKIVPEVGQYLSLRDDLGGRVSLLVIVNGSWLPQGGLISDDDTVEIHPPISGGIT